MALHTCILVFTDKEQANEADPRERTAAVQNRPASVAAGGSVPKSRLSQ